MSSVKWIFFFYCQKGRCINRS